MSGRGRGRAQAYNQREKKPRKESEYESAGASGMSRSQMSSSRSTPSFSDEGAEYQRPRNSGKDRGEPSTSGSDYSSGSSRRRESAGVGRGGGLLRSDSARSGGLGRRGDWGRGGDYGRSGDSARGGDYGRSGDSARGGDYGRSGDSARGGDYGRSGDSARGGDYGRSGDSARGGDYGRSGDSARGGDYGRSGDSGRGGDYGRGGDSGRGDYGRGGDSGRGDYGRGGDSGRGDYGRYGDSGRGGGYGRGGDSGRGDYGRSGDSGRGGDYGRSGDSGRGGDYGRSGDSGRGDYGRSGDSGRGGDYGRSGDSGRGGDYGRGGDSGRGGDYGRGGDSGRGDYGRSGDSGRGGDYGRSGDAGRKADSSRGGDSGRGGDFGRSGDAGRKADSSRGGDSGRGGDYGRSGDAGRKADSSRGGDASRGAGGAAAAAATDASGSSNTGEAGAVARFGRVNRPRREGVLKTRPDMCISKRGNTDLGFKPRSFANISAAGICVLVEYTPLKIPAAEKLAKRLGLKPKSTRSKTDRKRKEVTLHSNYFRISTMPNWVIYQYRTDFSVEDTEHQKKAWLREHIDVVGRAYIFDGTMLFSTKLLTEADKPLTLKSIRELDKTPVNIEVRFVQKVSYGSHIYLQVFNILVRRSLSYLKLQLVHRNYFDALAAIQLPQLNMEIWPGYITSIKQNETSILMCAELTHKIMRKDTARDLLLECVRQGNDYKACFQQAMSGQIVLTDYNNKTYKIEDVDYDSTPESVFTLKNEEVVTFLEYYERRYKIRIRDLKQPLLVAHCNQPRFRDGVPTSCLLIPELCRMTGLDEKMAECTRLKKTLSEYTRISPAERMRRVMHFNQRLQASKEVMREFDLWDMKLDKNLLQVPGRELPPETIIGGDGEKYSAGRGTDWIREVRSRPMLKAAVLREWAVIFPSLLNQDVASFIDALRKAGSGMNFRLPQPRLVPMSTDRPAQYVDAVEDLVGRNKLDLLMFVCSNSRIDRYTAIKRKCCVDRGLQSQVILSKNLKGKGLSVATKVAIQLNCKLGGAPWSIDVPLQNVMVVGYDVCHDTKNKTKSYGAVVASLNNTLSSWYSVVNHHSCGEEVSNGLAADVSKALLKYKQINGCLPVRIFVYRDGVGEGQLNFVYEHEVKCLKTALSSVYGGEHWKLGYIIVSKRIHTRLFKEDGNPVAGTVIDDIITLPERYDFFLISQNVNAGTVTPTNYNVISDNLGLKPDQIQRWTYKMAHLYYNWSGTVRVPAPCQYAHKLAFLVGQAIHVQPHARLNDTLYFL